MRVTFITLIFSAEFVNISSVSLNNHPHSLAIIHEQGHHHKVDGDIEQVPSGVEW
jgi:hypothetical protein